LDRFHTEARYEFKVNFDGADFETLTYGVSFGEPDFNGRQHLQVHALIGATTVWLAFLIGAIGGGLAAACYGLRCIIAPAVALFALGIFCWPFGLQGEYLISPVLCSYIGIAVMSWFRVAIAFVAYRMSTQKGL
jgi:hypothetical protein